MAARVVIVADDLTGAMDVAGPLAERGLATLAVASPQGCAPSDLHGAEVISINADSRHSSAKEAAARVSRIVSELVDPSAGIAIKKIDSTLRGNVVEETLAFLRASGRTVAVIAPAFPGQKRTVRGGVVHVDGVPLPDTDFARDALSPAPRLPLQQLFAQAAPDADVRLLRAADLPVRLNPAQRQILVVDADTDADLEQSVRALRSDLRHVLLVGSAGIAQAVGAVCFADAVPRQQLPIVSGRILVVVGSRARRSAEQVQRLLETSAAHFFAAPNGTVDVEAMAKSQARILVVRTTIAPDGKQGDAVEVAGRLAEGVSALLRPSAIGAVVATGGDTAVAILQRLGRSTLRVIGNLLPGIPYSRVDGPAGELWFVTKAGGFGAPDTFATIAARLGGG